MNPSTLASKITCIIILVFFSFQLNAQSLLDKRINTFVNAMTTQERINQLINSSFGGTPSNPRLGIPGFYMDDGPHGVRLTTDKNGRTATAFPTGIAMAATWDQDIALKVGEAMGLEFWAFNRTNQLGPCIDLCRDPRGGRSAESGGEDAYLAGHIGKSVAIGIQKNPIIATVKHYMGESKQSNRHNMDVLVTDRWLMDFSGYNFRTVVQEAGVMSLMGSYNKINGDKGCESYATLTTNLRDRWGFPFMVVSDWDAIWDSQKALKAGNDICMGSNKYATDLPGMVLSGAVTNDDLNTAVRRVLRTKILDGMLDYFPVGNISFAKTPEINAINKLAAQKSIVLLKNENKLDGIPILPLKKTGIKIALIGPNATGKNLNCYGSSATYPPYAISVKDGIEAKIGTANVSYYVGCDINSDSRTGFDAAKTLAATADVVIFAGGLDETQEGEGFNSGTDRKNGSTILPGQQMLLIQQLSLINPNVVVVIQSGGICSMNYCISNIKGLVYSFYAAQEAGTAIADVLFGDYNPGGKLPVTMPKKDSDLPSWSEELFRRFTDNLDGGYHWFDEKGITPEFAFGFGLSYTTFTYSNMIVSPVSMAGQPLTVSIDVTNTGNINGEEVAQLYLSCPSTVDVWMPKKQLRGFQRIALNSGETKTVTFKLNADDFYFWNGNRYQAQAGNFTLKAGGSSDNLTLSKNITLADADQKPDLKITQIYTMPRYPLSGQTVSFYALVKNQGNAAIPSNSPFKIDYKVNGAKVASSDNITTAIEPGQVQLIASTGVWNSNIIAKTTLSGELAFNAGASTEWDATNNTFAREFEVFDPILDPKVSNLAYLKPTSSSSDYNTNTASNLVDGDLSSRWESARTDNEYVMVDLKMIAELKKITIFWEASFAKKYKIESSLDAINWTMLNNVSSGAGGTETYTVNSVQGRYVKITCLERTLINNVKYGFSIYEFIINGNVIQNFPDVVIAPVESPLYLPYAKAILNGTGSGGALIKEKLNFLWSLVSGPTDVEIEDPTAALTLVKFKTAGTYVFKLTGTNSAGTNHVQTTIKVLNAGIGSDLALMKPTSCSSVESGLTSSDMAVDGSSTTRWSSAWQDRQWWMVDLLHQITPGTINIVWETAYAKMFNIEISVDNKIWQTYYSNSAFSGGESIITNLNSVSGRYFRVNCVQRSTNYGSSFYSFTVDGTFINSSNHVPVANAGSDILTRGDAILNGSASSDADNDNLIYKWEQLGGPSIATIKNSTSQTTELADLMPGEYFFKLNVDDGKDVDFDVIKVEFNQDTKLKDILKNGIEIYPNPVYEYFTIKNFDNQPVDTVQILNMNGKLIKNMTLITNTISMNGIASGNYLVRFLSSGSVKRTIQIVKI